MSALTKQLGEVLTAVTEDRHRSILHFENGSSVAIGPVAPDSGLESNPWHTEACARRWAVSGHCSCVLPTQKPNDGGRDAK